MSDEKKHLPVTGRLPVTWKGADTSIRSTALVAQATDADVALFADQRARTCGTCRFFMPQHLGQKFSEKEAFLAHVVKEAGWKQGFLCEDPAKMGRCKQNADLATGPNVTACDHWRSK